MSEGLPPPGEFGFAFVEFMRAMHEAAAFPEPPWVARIREHLGVEPRELPVTAGEFRIADRPNFQLALDAVLPERELIGLSPHEGGGFASVLHRRGPGAPSEPMPVNYIDVEVGDGRVVRCIAAAIVLTRFDDAPLALVVAPSERHGPPHMAGQGTLRVEGVSPQEGTVSSLLSALRAAMLEHNVFRGRIISLDPAGGVAFHHPPHVERDAVVLPEGALDRLEQHALSISEHAEELRAAGRHLKRGVLLHGPPGTGKTLTINHLLTVTAGRTTVLLTGAALPFISTAFSIARELAPATVVLEDVDLVARERPMGGGGVLFELLNQLEGLAEDVDLLAVLTTNRPDLVEPALAARPGRVDLALETPVPDADGRRRLLQLYAREIPLEREALDDLVGRTEGVTGAFIKELMRQATLRAVAANTTPSAADVRAIVDELLHERAALTRRLLGQGADGASTDLLGEPPPHMRRAVTAPGLPMPPGAYYVER